MDKPIDRDYALQPELCRKVEETLTNLFQRYRTTRDVTPEQLHLTVQSIYDSTYGLLDDDISQLLDASLAVALEELTAPNVIPVPYVATDGLIAADPSQTTTMAITVTDSVMTVTAITGEQRVKTITCDTHMDACRRATTFIEKRLKEWEKIC